MKLILDADVILYQSLPRDTLSAFPIAIETYMRLKEQFAETCFATETVSCLSSEGTNFRKIEYDIYKANRVGTKPDHLFDLKDWVWENDPDVVGSWNGEADDRVMTIAAECRLADEPYVIGSVDKDLKTYPGTFFNLRTREFQVVTPRQALDFLFEQLLTGDSTDGIAGLYKVGPVRARKILDMWTTDEEKFYGIKNIWEEHKGETWEEAFNQDTNLVFIRRNREDIKSLDFSSMGWEDFRSMLRFHLQDHEDLGW